MRRPKLSDQLRELIRESGIPRNQISKATGVDPAVLCRFLNGQGHPSLPTIDVLAEYFGWEVRSKPKKKDA